MTQACGISVAVQAIPGMPAGPALKSQDQLMPGLQYLHGSNSTIAPLHPCSPSPPAHSPNPVNHCEPTCARYAVHQALCSRPTGQLVPGLGLQQRQGFPGGTANTTYGMMVARGEPTPPVQAESSSRTCAAPSEHTLHGQHCAQSPCSLHAQVRGAAGTHTAGAAERANKGVRLRDRHAAGSDSMQQEGGAFMAEGLLVEVSAA